jgi:hypothetical protein
MIKVSKAKYVQKQNPVELPAGRKPDDGVAAIPNLNERLHQTIPVKRILGTD